MDGRARRKEGHDVRRVREGGGGRGKMETDTGRVYTRWEVK